MISERALKNAFDKVRYEFKLVDGKIEKLSEGNDKIKDSISDSFKLIKDDIKEIGKKVEKLEKVKDFEKEIKELRKELKEDIKEFKKDVKDKSREKKVEKNILEEEKEEEKEDDSKKEEDLFLKTYPSLEDSGKKPGKRGWFKSKFEKLVDFLAEEDDE